MNMLSQEQALAGILNGDLVLYPTETFYAIGCDALNSAAVAKVYAAKRRPDHLPLPVIIGEMAQLELLTESGAAAQPLLRDLLQRFWPGPLTLLFPARPGLPPALSAGTGQVAVRLSSHPAASALSRRAARPLVSSSANLSGQPAARSVRELGPSLLSAALGVLRGGPAPAGGLPSTIIALENGKLRLRRAGAISQEALQAQGFALLE